MDFLPRACGMRWRKASPRRPPEAKLSRTLSRFWCWSLLDWTGIRKRMRNGAALIRSVAPMACREREGDFSFASSNYDINIIMKRKQKRLMTNESWKRTKPKVHPHVNLKMRHQHLDTDHCSRCVCSVAWAAWNPEFLRIKQIYIKINKNKWNKLLFLFFFVPRRHFLFFFSRSSLIHPGSWPDAASEKEISCFLFLKLIGVPEHVRELSSSLRPVWYVLSSDVKLKEHRVLRCIQDKSELGFFTFLNSNTDLGSVGGTYFTAESWLQAERRLH